MVTERSLEELEQNQIKEFPDSRLYHALSCTVWENYEDSFKCNLELKLKNKKNSDFKIIEFNNVSYEDEFLRSIREAIGFYIINTSFLGYGPNQRYEVGDWDGDPPIFWAESFKLLK